MTSNGTKEKEKVMQGLSLDQAMLETGFGIYNISNMLLSGMILMGMIMVTLGLGYVIPAAQCDLELTQTQKGWLAAIPFVAIILTSHFWGWLADTRGRRPVMLLSMTVSVIIIIISSFAPNLAIFAVLQFIACIFTSGPASGVVYAYLGEFNSLRHRDKMVAFGASFVGIGTVVLPAISWLILPLDFNLPISFLGIMYRPWRLLVVACAMPFFISCVCMIWAPESPKYLYSTGQHDTCLKVLQSMFATNKRLPVEDFPVKSLHIDPVTTTISEKTGVIAVLISMRDQTIPLFKPPLLIWTAISCFVQLGIFATTNGFYVWFPTILNSLANHEGNETKICDVLGAEVPGNSTQLLCDDSVNTSIFERAIIVGLVFCSMYIIVGAIVDLVGKKSILVFTLGVAGLCGIFAHVVSDQQVAVSLFAIFQMSGACIGLLTAVVVEQIPTKLRAMAVCLSLMFGRVGSVLGSNLIGQLLKSNCGVSFYLFGGLLIVCSLLCVMLPGVKKTKEDKQPIAEPTQSDTHEPI